VLGSGTDVVLILATIHGNEWAGTPLCQALVSKLRFDVRTMENKKVVVIPVANPDGYAAKRRTNFRGVDINRNFPTSNRVDTPRNGAALSEPESQAIMNVLGEFRPRRIVSIHQPLACIDFDGPGEGLAAAMSQHAGLPIKKLGALPGSLGSFAAYNLNVPIITLELPPNAEKLSDAQLWSSYGEALMEAIRYP
jgi:protein MpaA